MAKPNSNRNRNDKKSPRKLTRAQAAAAARRRAARRRRLTAVGAVALLLGLAAAAFLWPRDDGDSSAKSSSTSTTAAGSVKGKPCVKMADDPPAGAPKVPVKVGPPPKTLFKDDIKEGTGAVVQATDTLKVNYIGVSCSSGKTFDSSYATGQPAEFPLSNVIDGWKEGIPGMKVGGQRVLGIPSELAYGSTARSADIPPDEALWFVIQVLEAKPTVAPTPPPAAP